MGLFTYGPESKTGSEQLLKSKHPIHDTKKIAKKLTDVFTHEN